MTRACDELYSILATGLTTTRLQLQTNTTHGSLLYEVRQPSPPPAPSKQDLRRVSWASRQASIAPVGGPGGASPRLCMVTEVH